MRPETQRILLIIGNTVGIVAGVFGMVIAIAASPLYGGIISFIFIVVFGYFFGGQYLRNKRNKQLLETGISAQARIAEVWDTGVTVNNQPQIGMKIEVYPSGGAPFTSEIKMIISRLSTSYYQPGVNCTVKYDPNDTSTVAIASLG